MAAPSLLKSRDAPGPWVTADAPVDTTTEPPAAPEPATISTEPALPLFVAAAPTDNTMLPECPAVELPVVR